MQTIYKRSIRSLSLQELVIIRKWLRHCYQECLDNGDRSGAAELLLVGRRVSDTVNFITTKDNPAQIVEW